MSPVRSNHVTTHFFLLFCRVAVRVLIVSNSLLWITSMDKYPILCIQLGRLHLTDLIPSLLSSTCPRTRLLGALSPRAVLVHSGSVVLLCEKI